METRFKIYLSFGEIMSIKRGIESTMVLLTALDEDFESERLLDLKGLFKLNEELTQKVMNYVEYLEENSTLNKVTEADIRKQYVTE